MRYRSNLLLALLLPSVAQAQAVAPGSAPDPIIGIYAEDGLSGGPQGSARITGLNFAIGIRDPVRLVARYSRRTKGICATSGPCPTAGTFVEFGLGFRLAGAYRIVPFADMLAGFSRERKPYREVVTSYTSASASIGFDFRLTGPLFLRTGLRLQKVLGTNRSDGRRGGSLGVFAGLGLASW